MSLRNNNTAAAPQAGIQSEARSDKQRAANNDASDGQTVTQLTPDDQLEDGGAMPCDDGQQTPTWREVEQDTVAVNPSVESMDSRG